MGAGARAACDPPTFGLADALPAMPAPRAPYAFAPRRSVASTSQDAGTSVEQVRHGAFVKNPECRPCHI